MGAIRSQSDGFRTQHVYCTDVLSGRSCSKPALRCSLDRYVQHLCLAERIRVYPFLALCIDLAGMLGGSLRMVALSVHQHRYWRSILSVFQLVSPDPRVPVLLSLPTRCVVRHPVVDVVFGRMQGLSFHALARLIEEMTVLLTLLVLLGWRDPDQHLVVHSCFDDTATRLTVVPHRRHPEATGARVIVLDERADLLLLHQFGRHGEFLIVALDQFRVTYGCPYCGRTQAALRGSPICHSCGGSITDAWSNGMPVDVLFVVMSLPLMCTNKKMGGGKGTCATRVDHLR